MGTLLLKLQNKHLATNQRVTEEMIDMTEERRKWKSLHSEGCKNINRLRRITDKARENGGI